jgi:hypothetical protein
MWEKSGKIKGWFYPFRILSPSWVKVVLKWEIERGATAGCVKNADRKEKHQLDPG